MKFFSSKKSKFAFMLLLVWVFNLLTPPLALALTSGPAQPETQGFQPAGVSDMVDLQSGDFKYNIPLLDLDGYPINLNYQSGVGMDDEASWVGLGWSLNTGSVTRQVRGLPDDMSGDAYVTDHYTRPMVTVGGRLTAKVELFGNGVTDGTGTLSYGVYNNNYTGVGVELAANAGISVTRPNDGSMIASLGLGISSDSQKGVDVSANAVLSIAEHARDNSLKLSGLSSSLGYNTRAGMKNLTLSATFKPLIYNAGLSTNLCYNTEPVSPKIQIPYKSTSTTFSIDAGPTGFGVFAGGGLSGYRTIREVLNQEMTNPGYGFLYAENGKNDSHALMDFIRENENPIIPEIPNIAVPIQTPDLFSYTSQSGGGQFRLYRGGTGMFFDNQVKDQNLNQTFGADFGFGFGFHGGVTYFRQNINNTTQKWTRDNAYLPNGDFQNASNSKPDHQQVGFRMIGEKNIQDASMASLLGNTDPVKLDITDRTANSSFNSGNVAINSQVEKLNRQQNKTVISYLTASEAQYAGLDKQIDQYPFYTEDPTKPFQPPVNNIPLKSDAIPRVDGSVRKAHHISEITVTDEGGKRLVYGLPVYNTKHEEYSFDIGSSYTTVNTNQVALTTIPTIGNDITGTDNYYHKESKPAYATSYLLSGILSPDYVDKTGDGITDDDLGTAIKFDYSKLTDNFKWRTPYQNATINRGLLADPDDDKASIIYGEKEIWYVSSISTKTKIAYFITQDRNDALGVIDANGGLDINGPRQKCLKEVRLYSKADMTKPIKVVKFDYSYDLCHGVPNYNDGNSSTTGGKLTLRSLHFEYQNSDKGINHPYKFTYANGANNPNYAYMSTDRWGAYKTQSQNIGTNLSNEDFPYADQNKTQADQNIANWSLTTIGLPTGGTINVNYESDDYAYVQNRKAMQMVGFESLINSNLDKTTDLASASGIKLKIPLKPIPSTVNLRQWFIDTYLDGSEYLYTKFYARIANSNSKSSPGKDYDFVPCYAKVKNVTLDSKGDFANIIFEDIRDGNVTANPIIMATWQRIKNDYPRYAYPGFDNRVDGNSSTTIYGVISATITAAGNLGELLRSFYQKASDPGNRDDYGNIFDQTKSFVRITKNDGPKIGGGARVKYITISDNWADMSGNSVSTNDANKIGTYGQSYEYTTTEGGSTISSGVATYEPSVGNDENPFKQPVPYIQKIKGAINNYFDLEEPFGESVFPAPSVTYSKVTVRDLNYNDIANKSGILQVDPVTNSPANPQTGKIVNEFYTSRDFPVRVKVLPITSIHNTPASYFTFINSMSDDELCMSQGYSIELNDMNGKSKATHVLNQSNGEISSTQYFYNSTDNGSGEKTLSNKVDVVHPNGIVENLTLGQDIEMFTDFREQESSNTGLSINLGSDIFTIGFLPVILAHFPISVNDDYKLFRSASAFKVVQSYGILDHVVKTESGSSITTQNIAFDELTGEALVTRTQNEFNNNIYSVNIPAYWAYAGMGPAYQNLGEVYDGLTTDAKGAINASSYTYVHKGDEIVDLTTGEHFWVIEHTVRTDYNGNNYDVGKGYIDPIIINYDIVTTRYLIRSDGSIKPNLNTNLPSDSKVHIIKIVRSGYRNILNAGITSLVTLNNPITKNQLQLNTSGDLTSALKVINATATTYDENWGMQAPTQTFQSIVEDKSHDWQFQRGSQLDGGFSILDPYAENGKYGFQLEDAYTQWYEKAGYPSPYIYLNNYGSYWLNGGPFASVAIIPNDATLLPNYGMGLISTFTVDGSDCFLGFNSTIPMIIDIDNNYIQGNLALPDDVSYTAEYGQRYPYHGWVVRPLYLSAGKHTIIIYLFDTGSLLNASGTGFGVELYNNNSSDLYNAKANGTPLKKVFSTEQYLNPSYDKSALPQHQQYILFNRYVYNNVITKPIYRYTWSDGTPYNFQDINVPKPINPYLYGFAGNWRTSQTKVFQENRIYASTSTLASGKLDLKNAGYINNFFSYWYNQGISPTWITNSISNKWITSNSVTLYDKYGQQLENVDALNRFSAANFDFNGELPAAVASNAMNREIYSNSFEDFSFKPGGNMDNIPERDFLASTSGSSFIQLNLISNSQSHSGNYCAQIPVEGLTLSTILYKGVQSPGSHLSVDQSNQYIKSGNFGTYPNGFEPKAGKKYLINAWIKDGDITMKSTALSISANIVDNFNNITNITVPVKCKALVEGWKLVEGVIDLSTYQNVADGTQFNITIRPPYGANTYIDDIRIHPYDSQMKTYAYDDKTMRLMAEMDENCFATFYEYDSQGLLVRVKKETERGVMTLKESRSSYKKQ